MFELELGDFAVLWHHLSSSTLHLLGMLRGLESQQSRQWFGRAIRIRSRGSWGWKAQCWVVSCFVFCFPQRVFSPWCLFAPKEIWRATVSAWGSSHRGDTKWPVPGGAGCGKFDATRVAVMKNWKWHTSAFRKDLWCKKMGRTSEKRSWFQIRLATCLVTYADIWDKVISMSNKIAGMTTRWVLTGFVSTSQRLVLFFVESVVPQNWAWLVHANF